MTIKRLLPVLLCTMLAACGGAKIKEQQGAIIACQQELGALRSEQGGCSTKLSATISEKTDLEGKVSDLERKVKSADERVASLMKSNKDLSKSLEANKGELQGKVKELIAEKDELGRKLAEGQKEKIALERAGTNLQRKLAQDKVQREKLGAELAAAKGEAERLAGEQKDKSAAEQAAADKAQAERSARLAKTREEMGTLADVMLKELQAEKAKVDQDKDAIAVTLLEPLLFEPQQAKLTETGMALLGRLGAPLHALGRTVRVEAHSDNSPIKWDLFGGRFTSHWDLSSARATAVARYLHEHGGLDPRRLTASGFGEFHPVKGNDTPEGREANKRVVLVVEPAAP